MWPKLDLAPSKTAAASAQLKPAANVTSAPARPAGQITPAAASTQRNVAPRVRPNFQPSGVAGQSAQPSQPSQQPQADPFEDARRAQESAAAAAAEARRRAAQGKYESQKRIAENAKGTAKGQFDWLVETLGSNKKDLLDQVGLNESQGITNYGIQDKQTRDTYDSSKKEILSTYRDLNKEQEKILRGSGMQSSSRSQEAQLRLNSLMGKDLSGVSKNEADSIAMIGTALSQFKEKVLSTKTSVERESKSKLDKAAIDFDTQTKAIDANLYLSENEREDAFASAEAQLAQDRANIETWSAGVKLQQQQTLASLKGQVDNFIVDMASGEKLLGADLQTKRAATNKMLTDAGWTSLQANDPNMRDATVGVQQKKLSRGELDSMLASGQITQSQYNSQVGATSAPNTLISTTTAGGQRTNPALTSARQDPLLAALFA